jgi:integrase
MAASERHGIRRLERDAARHGRDSDVEHDPRTEEALMAWTERRASGRYRGAFRLPNGKIRSAGTFDHKRAAMNAAAAAEAAAASLGWRDPRAARRTWGAWRAEWWPTRAVEPSTSRQDASRVRARLAPRWDEVALIDVTRQDIRAWAAELAADGLSPASVQRCVHLLSASLSAAVDAEIIPANPALRLRLAAGQVSHERFLTSAEQAALLEQFSGVDRALVALLLGTGMRWGEAVGLQLKRIDTARGVVRVAEVWDDAHSTLKLYPKGRKIREVPLPDWAAEALEAHIAGRKTGHALVKGGAPIDYHNWRSRLWLPALREAELGPLRIHDLRHTYASTLIQAGVPLEEIGRLLGHVSPLTTRRYAHLAETPRDAVLAALPQPSRGADGEQDATAPGTNVIAFRARLTT